MKKLNSVFGLADESPHYESALEWWFVHGYYEGNNVQRRYFMASIFRHNFSNKKKSSGDTFSFLLSVLNAKTDQNTSVSWIDQPLMEAVVQNIKNIRGINLDPLFLDVLMDEIHNYEAPRGVEVVSYPPQLQSAPFSINWKDFSLNQGSEHLGFKFVEPETRNICDICLHPVQPRLEVEAARDVIGTKQGMKYFTYPKLSLSGFLNKEEVSGEAWFDHQWGDFSWFLPAGSEQRILSWEWFGINLENGTDWVLMVHRDAQSREPFAKHLTIRNKDGSVFSSKKFNLKSLRNWVSKKTYITYPLKWRIEVPELDAHLTFSPVADDQEIPVFGLMRSVWQGAGKISGSIAGISVSGRARGEFQGYGFIFNFKDFLKSFGDRVERHIEEFLPKVIQTDDLQKYVGLPVWEYEPIAYTKLLSEPTWDLILRGGKRWRPVIALLLLDTLGKQPDPYESLVCVLAELIHTGSLIIDDIEDSSLLRRGDECIHLRYGQDVAINAANTIYFLPTLLISEHPCLSKMQRLKILEVMMRQFVRAHFGQTLDLYWAQNMNLANIKRWLDDSFESKILQMYQFKTASPIEGLAETACIISGTDKKIRDACINFVNAFGVAFQIVDDIHNFSSSPQWSKLYGEDLAEGKITYVIYHALMSLKKSDQYRLMEILCSKELRKDPDIIREGAGLVQKSRVFEKCREEAKALVEPKWEIFSELIPSSGPKTLLQALFRSLLDQDFQ